MIRSKNAFNILRECMVSDSNDLNNLGMPYQSINLHFAHKAVEKAEEDLWNKMNQTFEKFLVEDLEIKKDSESFKKYFESFQTKLIN